MAPDQAVLGRILFCMSARRVTQSPQCSQFELFSVFPFPAFGASETPAPFLLLTYLTILPYMVESPLAVWLRLFSSLFNRSFVGEQRLHLYSSFCLVSD